MTGDSGSNPALAAAIAAEKQVKECLQANTSFLLEAGAGAGKTYSLVEALRSLITIHEKRLRAKGQRIACITYTNVATAVIREKIDGNAVVFIDTIHAFCWSLIKSFQSFLRQHVAGLPAWKERLEQTAVRDQSVEYDLGYRRISETSISLHHDDVLSLSVALLSVHKFQAILADRFPFILIDEYQDTNDAVMEAIKHHMIGKAGAPLIGLFGDHWQRIYDDTCGSVTHTALTPIGKKANFRSATSIVKVLNKMRPSLPQEFRDPAFEGSALAYHTNSWSGTRRSGAGGGHWKDDLPADAAHQHLRSFIEKLKNEGWDFSEKRTKVLMLTHNVLAAEQGYENLAGAFDFTDQFIKKEDDYIGFFVDKIEPACSAFQSKRYGQMLEALGNSASKVQSHEDKRGFAEAMGQLAALRHTGTIGDVIKLLKQSKYVRLPEAVERREKDADSEFADGVEIPRQVRVARALRAIKYSEVMALTDFINGHSPFATKHSVKGDEFENVLVVVGRGWNKYNFDQYLTWAGSGGIPEGKQDAYERYRNLFYVCCSRPQTRLAVFFTQKLSDESLETLRAWFGTASVRDFSIGTGTS